VAVRITVYIPETLYRRLRGQAECSGASIRGLIVRALEEACASPENKRPVTGPLVSGSGKLGPLFPIDENPNELII
jgi:hypothetical protein